MNRQRLIPLLLSLTLLLSALSGCGQLRSARPITDVNHLDGQRVGVVLSWAPDYLLSDREDLTLIRYNTYADLVMALCFQRIDAISVEQPLAPLILQSVEGVRCIQNPLATDGLTALISPSRKDVLDSFNAFIADYVGSPEYEDLYRRSKSLDKFVPVSVPEAESDKVLKVCVVDDSYPFSYIDFETGEFEGIDVEVLRQFAYTCGYRLEMSGGNWDAMDLGVCSERYDIGVGGVSDLYRGDYEMSGLCYVSDLYMPMDLVFIEIDDPEALRISAAIER